MLTSKLNVGGSCPKCAQKVSACLERDPSLRVKVLLGLAPCDEPLGILTISRASMMNMSDSIYQLSYDGMVEAERVVKPLQKHCHIKLLDPQHNASVSYCMHSIYGVDNNIYHTVR